MREIQAAEARIASGVNRRQEEIDSAIEGVQGTAETGW
jgi:hypothetical protein